MAATRITVRSDGPYVVKGPVELFDADGNRVELPAGTKPDEPIALCRCGGSTNKPFCDGMHSLLAFNAANRAVKASEKRGWWRKSVSST